MKTAPYSAFGKTANVKVEIYIDAKYVDNEPRWDKELWVEQPEDWYAFANTEYKGKRVRVVKRDEWIMALNIKSQIAKLEEADHAEN